MTTNKTRGKNIGGPLEYTVSEVLHKSVEELVDAGKRFTIVNNADAEEEDYGNRFADS